MTINRYVSIVCDAWDFPEVIKARTERCEDSYEGDGFLTVESAVESARENGWLIRPKGVALCPACRKHLKRKKRT